MIEFDETMPRRQLEEELASLVAMAKERGLETFRVSPDSVVVFCREFLFVHIVHPEPSAWRVAVFPFRDWLPGRWSADDLGPVLDLWCRLPAPERLVSSRRTEMRLTPL